MSSHPAEIPITPARARSAAAADPPQGAPEMGARAQDAVFRQSLGTQHFDYLSPAIEALTGFPVEDLVGAAGVFEERLVPEDRARLVPDAPSPRVHFRHRDGSLRMLQVHARVLCDPQGVPRWHVGFFRAEAAPEAVLPRPSVLVMPRPRDRRRVPARPLSRRLLAGMGVAACLLLGVGLSVMLSVPSRFSRPVPLAALPEEGVDAPTPSLLALQVERDALRQERAALRRRLARALRVAVRAPRPAGGPDPDPPVTLAVVPPPVLAPPPPADAVDSPAPTVEVRVRPGGAPGLADLPVRQYLAHLPLPVAADPPYAR